MHGCLCLFTSDNSCPAYAVVLSMCYDSSFGGMACHFLSSVRRTSVITEARARLFYRTSCEGRSDDGTVLPSVCSLFSLSSSLFPSHCFFTSSHSLCSLFSLSLSRWLLSLTHVQFSLTIGEVVKKSNSWRNTVRIAVDFFLTTVSSHWALIGCAAAKVIGKIPALNGIMLSKEAKTLMCALPCQFQLIVRERKNGFLFLSVIRNNVEQQ